MSYRQKILVADSSKYFDAPFWNMLIPDTEFHVVGQAGSTAEAVTMAADLTPDIILADLFHSEMQGLKTVKNLRQARPQATIITFSPDTSIQYEQAALQAGANACVTKSELVDTLVHVLYKLIKSKPSPNGHNSKSGNFTPPSLSPAR